MTAPDVNRRVIELARAHRGAAAGLLGELGLYPGQELLVLRLAAQGPTLVSQLAAAIGVEVPTVTRMVGRMEAAGFVRRSRDPADGRAVWVHLTEAGAGIEQEVRARWQHLAECTTAGMSTEEVTALCDLLARATASLRDLGASADDTPRC